MSTKNKFQSKKLFFKYRNSTYLVRGVQSAVVRRDHDGIYSVDYSTYKATGTLIQEFKHVAVALNNEVDFVVLIHEDATEEVIFNLTGKVVDKSFKNYSPIKQDYIFDLETLDSAPYSMVLPAVYWSKVKKELRSVNVT